MRTIPDRLRQAVLFEALGLSIITPACAYLFDQPASHMGVVGTFASTLAMIWNFVFNLGFDRAMLRVFGHTTKTVAVRIVQAALFEIGFLIMLIPPVSWYLGMSLWDTFVMDMSIAAFYMVYAFGFSLAYDRIFPVPVHRAEDAAERSDDRISIQTFPLGQRKTSGVPQSERSDGFGSSAGDVEPCGICESKDLRHPRDELLRLHT